MKSSDLEIAQRVQALVRKLEDRQLTATMLMGKRVRLKVTQATANRAVADLAKESGYDVQAAFAANDTGSPNITLDTGDTTFWGSNGATMRPGRDWSKQPLSLLDPI